MKLLKTGIAFVATLVCASAALAQTNVNITGSTAYRANTYRAIQAVIDPGYTLAYNGASGQSGLEGSQYSIFIGTVGGAPVRIKTSFTGSEGGIQVVSHQDNLPYYPDTQTTSVFPGNGGSGVPTNLEKAQVAMSDTQQAASVFNGTYKGKFYPALTEDPNSPVGIVPFKFIASPSAAGAGLTNMTSQLFRALVTSGTQPLSLFTGNSANSGTTVYLTGRDPDSGTRVTTYVETGFGISNLPTQYAPLNGSGSVITTAGGTIASFALYPAGTANGIAYGIGRGGYNSGGKLAAAVNNTPPANTLLVGYAATNDADPQIGGVAPFNETELAFNGVTLGNVGGDYNNDQRLTYGQYTFWSYEHMYVNTGDATIQGVADAIANDLKTTHATILLSNMHAGRAGNVDGGTVLPQ